MNILLVILTMSALSFIIALYLVTLVFTQSNKMTIQLLRAEISSFFRPKRKINIFKKNLNDTLKKDLQKICSTSDKKLAETYIDFSKDDIKKIKQMATVILKQKSDIVSFEDTKQAMKDDGYLNFFTSYQRLLDFYVNPNHQTNFFEMSSIPNEKRLTSKQLLIERHKKDNNNQIFSDLKIFTWDHTQNIIDKLLFKNISAPST